MKDSFKEKIINDFGESDYELVLSELNTITLKHVMASSQSMLEDTKAGVLRLSKGDLQELEYLINVAKRDCRDILYWVSLDNTN